MASPQKEDGFVQIANELLPALMSSFGGIEGLIVSVVIMQQYGADKRPHAIFSPAEFEAITQLAHGNGYRALRKLVKAGVLAPVGTTGHAYRFNKDRDKWNLGSPSAMGWLKGPVSQLADWAKERFGLVSSSKNKQQIVSRGTQDKESLVSHGEHDKAPRVSHGTQDRLSRVSPETQADANGWGTIGGSGAAHAPASEDLETGEKKDGESERAPTELEPFDAPTELLPEITGPGRDDPEAKAMIEWAKSLGRDEKGASYADWAALAVSHAPVAWIRAILNRKVATVADRHPIRVIAKILADWRLARKPEPWAILAPPAPNGHPAPSKEDQRMAGVKAGVEARKSQSSSKGTPHA